MDNKIRTQTNQIYNKIRKSLKRQTATPEEIKLVDRRTEARYHTANK